MAIMAENVIVADFENHPLMLEKDMYDRWKTRLMLYIQDKENGDMLLDSIKNETFKIEEEITVKDTDGVTDIKHKQTPNDLAPKERLRYDKWRRFFTAAKQARDLHIVNFDQLYAFLKHNKKDTKDVQEMRQLFLDPLALLAKTYNPPPAYSSQNIQFHSQPHEVYQPYQYYQSTTLATQQLIQSPLKQSYAPPVVLQQPPMMTTQHDSGFVVPTFLLTDDQIASLNKAMIILTGVVLNEEQQDFLANGLEENGDCDDLQLHTTTNFKGEHVDAYDSDCNDQATPSAIFMASLSFTGSLNDDTVTLTYDSNTITEVPHYDTYHDDYVLNSIVQETEYNEHSVSYDDSYVELTSDSNVISYVEYLITIQY
ncbi:hypothetical protein Tco_1214713 [Tanacetum coccineum]